MPPSVSPDTTSPGVQLVEGDSFGPLKQNWPVVTTFHPYTAQIEYVLILPQPVSARDFFLRLSGPAGTTVTMSAYTLWGRYSAHHDTYSQRYNFIESPYVNGTHELWRGNLLSREEQPHLRSLVIPQQHIRYRRLRDGVSFTHNDIRYNTGPGLIYAVAIRLHARIMDSRSLEPRSVQVELEGNSGFLVRKTLLVVPHCSAFPEWREHKLAVSRMGTYADLLGGGIQHAIALFSARGPGLPVSMNLNYYSDAASYGRTLDAPNLGDDLAYRPFGNGWGCLYSMKLLLRNYQVRTFDQVEDWQKVYFQDANGRIFDVGQARAQEAVDFGSIGGYGHDTGISPSFDEAYHTLRSRRLEDGSFELVGKHLKAHFDRDGYLIRMIRPHHGRPLLLQRQGGSVTITDSSGRRTVWQLQGERVHGIVDPAGREWRCIYSGDQLIELALNGTQIRYQFDYDTMSGLLTSVLHPTGLVTRIHYKPPGPDNRLFAFTVHKVEEQGGAYDFVYSSGDDYLERFTLVLQDPERVTTTYRYNRHDPQSTDGSARWEMSLGGAHEIQALNTNLQIVRRSMGDGMEWYTLRDRSGALIRRGFPDGTAEVAVRSEDSAGNASARLIDRGGRVIYKRFGSQGSVERLLQTVTYPAAYPGEDDATEHYAYNGAGDLLQMTDAIGIVREYVRSNRTGFVGLLEREIERGRSGERLTTEYEYDVFGYLTRYVAPDGNESHFSYNRLQLLEKVSNADGSETHYEYTPTGLLRRVFQSGGLETTFVHDASGLILSETTRDKGRTLYTYDKLGRVRSVTDSSSNNTEYFYKPDGQISHIRENGSLAVEYEYNGLGQVAASVHRDEGSAGGLRVAYEYDACNRVTKALLPPVNVDGESWIPRIEYEYRGGDVSRVRRHVDATSEESLEYEYDGRGRIHKVVRHFPPDESSEEQFRFDAVGNLVMYEGPDFKWLSGTVPRAAVRPHNRRVRSEYRFPQDGLGRTTSVTDRSDTELAAVEYDQMGRIVALQMADDQGLHDVVRGAYDPLNGRIRSVYNEMGEETRVEYNLAGLPSRAIDPFGTESLYEYDAGGRPTRVIVRGRDGQEIESMSTYRPSGEVLTQSRVVNGIPRSFSYEWDENGNLIRERNPLGRATTFLYDEENNVQRKTWPDGTYATYQRDALGRVIRTQYSTGATLDFTYDGAGRLLSVENERIRQSTLRDSQGRPSEMRLFDKSGGFPERTIKLFYDLYEQIASIVDESGLKTDFTYDSAGRIQLVHQTMPGDRRRRKATYEYDTGGRLRRRSIHPGGLQSRFEYLPSGRPTRIYSLLPTFQAPMDIQYRYDKLGRVESVEYVHLGVQKEFVYDSIGRLTVESVKRGGGLLLEESWEYDQAGNCIRSTQNGVATTHVFDESDRLTRSVRTNLVIDTSGVTVTADTQLDSDHAAEHAFDQVTHDGMEAGKAFVSEDSEVEHWLELELSPARHLVALELHLPSEHGLPQRLGIAFQAPSSPSWQAPQATLLLGAHALAPDQSQTEFAQFVPTGRVVQLHFNPVVAGRIRIQQAAGDGPASGLYEHALALNEVRLYRTEEISTEYEYDENGNLTREGERRYEYGVENRLIRVREDGVVDVELTYGPDGELLVEIDHFRGTHVWKRYFGGELYEEFDPSGQIRRKFVKGNGHDLKLSVAESPQNGESDIERTFFLWDHQGSTHQMVRESNLLLESRLHNAWGESHDSAIVDGIADPDQYASAFGYCGRPVIANTGLMHYRGRVYHPGLRRFLSPDPLGSRDTLNLYTYAYNDPVNHRDSTGLEGEESVLGAYLSGFGEGLLIGARALGNAIPKTLSFGFYEGDVFGLPENPSDRRIYNVASVTARVSTEVAFAAATMGVSAAAKTAQGTAAGVRVLRGTAAVLAAGEVAQGVRDSGHGIAEIARGNWGTGAFFVVTGALSLLGGASAARELRNTPLGIYARGWGADIHSAVRSTPVSSGLNCVVIPNPAPAVRLIQAVARNRRIRTLISDAERIFKEEVERATSALSRTQLGTTAGREAGERIRARAIELGFDAVALERVVHVPPAVRYRFPGEDLAYFRRIDVAVTDRVVRERFAIELTLEDLSDFMRMSSHKRHQVPDYILAEWQPILINSTYDPRPWFGFLDYHANIGW